MAIRKFKEKVIKISLYLIVVGFIVALFGFGIAGFDLSSLKEGNKYKWYRTIQIN